MSYIENNTLFVIENSYITCNRLVIWFPGMLVMNNTINIVYLKFNDPQVASIAVLNQYTVPIESIKQI